MSSYHRTAVLSVLAVLAASASSCTFLGGDCVALAAFGIHATVVDAQTGQPLSAATMIVVDGSYADTSSRAASPNPSQGLYGALERPGVYTVTVMAPDYRLWSQSGVVVRRAGSCNAIQTVNLDARLAREAVAGG